MYNSFIRLLEKMLCRFLHFIGICVYLCWQHFTAICIRSFEFLVFRFSFECCQYIKFNDCQRCCFYNSFENSWQQHNLYKCILFINQFWSPCFLFFFSISSASIPRLLLHLFFCFRFHRFSYTWYEYYMQYARIWLSNNFFSAVIRILKLAQWIYRCRCK